jgi:serine/threonine protein kinase
MNPGTRLDHYEIVDKIGEGGMGAVYRARDTSLDRDVAVKVLPPSFTADANRVARFEREAKAVAALSHPNIVAMYGFGTADGVTYAAMELLQGRSLREHLDEGALPLRKAVEIARQIAAGLDAAHARGIVHRDLKPDNVFLTPDGRARILDFGLAATDETGIDGATDESARTRLTDPGTVVGTAGYMSPEQARGAKTGAATDLFALGVMLQEMLSGEHPFARETAAETLTAILREDAPEPTVNGRPLPAALGRIVRRCLEKSPEERFHSASDLAFALDSAMADSGASQPSMAAAVPVARTFSPGPILAAAGVVAMVAFAAGWWLRPTPPPTAPPLVRELTFTGHDQQPAVSPDGRLIAFTSSRNGVSQIWLRQVNGGSEQPLTEGSDFRPVFSPDNESVTFIRRDGNEYSAYRVGVLGGQPRKLIEDVARVAWSPDGRSLAFVRGLRDSGGGSSLGLFDLESGQERIIASFDERNLIGPSWSDDSRRIAAAKTGTQGAAGDWSLVVIDASAGEVQEVNVGANVLLSGPTWAGNDALIYARTSSTVSSSPDPNEIVRHELATGRERTLLWEPYLFPLRGGFPAATTISLLGDDRLVFDMFRQVQTIQELDLRDGSLGALSEALSSDRQPAYSPDGSRLVFTSNRSGNVDLFTYEFASQQLRQLTDHPANDWDGAYSPDGESIVWSSDRSGLLEIWMADADGSNPRQVSRDGDNGENPTMTPDGEWIVYSSGNREAPGIYKVRPDGSDSTVLVAGNGIGPMVSYDGRHALFLTNDAAALVNEVGVVEVATGNRVDFSIRAQYAPESPNVAFGRSQWMPGDEAIAFVGADSDGQPTVWVQDFVPGRDTTATRRLLEGAEAAGLVESFGVSPDGSRVALSTIRVIHTIKMAEGVGPLR